MAENDVKENFGLTLAASLGTVSLAIHNLPEPHRTAVSVPFTAALTEVLRTLKWIEEREQALLGHIQSAQVDSKYIEFDLEATRRERDQLLKERRNDDTEPSE